MKYILDLLRQIWNGPLFFLHNYQIPVTSLLTNQRQTNNGQQCLSEKKCLSPRTIRRIPPELPKFPQHEIIYNKICYIWKLSKTTQKTIFILTLLTATAMDQILTHKQLT